MKRLSEEEKQNSYGGDPISLSLVLTYLAVSLVTVAIWKLYISKKGKLVFPGGFNFEWQSGLHHYLNYF